MVPLVRELLRRGARVVVAANELPAINDMTYPEAAEVLRAAGEADAPLRDALADGRLACVSSGNDLPVMDLRRVSPGLAERAAGCDLVVLEGMGRSIETNLWAEMTTADCLNLGMIKHQEVPRLPRRPLRPARARAPFVRSWLWWERPARARARFVRSCLWWARFAHHFLAAPRCGDDWGAGGDDAWRAYVRLRVPVPAGARPGLMIRSRGCRRGEVSEGVSGRTNAAGCAAFSAHVSRNSHFNS